MSHKEGYDNMKYRQWKKNYKNQHGVNPPLELDKRKQHKLAKKAIKYVSSVDFAKVATRMEEIFATAYASIIKGIGTGFNAIGKYFNMVGNICVDIADDIQPQAGTITENKGKNSN